MSDLVDGLALAGNLFFTDGAVYDLVIGAFLLAGCGNYVFLNSLAGSMSDLVDGLALAGEFLSALGAVDDLVIGAFLFAGSGNNVLLYRLTGGMLVSGTALEGGILILPAAVQSGRGKLRLNLFRFDDLFDLVLGQTESRTNVVDQLLLGLIVGRSLADLADIDMRVLITGLALEIGLILGEELLHDIIIGLAVLGAFADNVADGGDRLNGTVLGSVQISPVSGKRLFGAVYGVLIEFAGAVSNMT